MNAVKKIDQIRNNT